MTRPVLAIAAGNTLAWMAGQQPTVALAGTVLAGGALTLLGFLVLALAASRRRRATRGIHQSDTPSGQLVRLQGQAFLLWFSGHSVLWSGVSLSAVAGALFAFGPHPAVLVATAGLLSAGALYLLGLAGWGPVGMLGLCWEYRVASPMASPRDAVTRLETAVALRPRFRTVLEHDAATARELGRMPLLTRVQVALDLERSNRSSPRVDFTVPLSRSASHESLHRASSLALVSLPAMLLATLMWLLGILSPTEAWNGSWKHGSLPRPPAGSSVVDPEQEEVPPESAAAETASSQRDGPGDGPDASQTPDQERAGPGGPGQDEEGPSDGSQEGRGQNDQGQEGEGQGQEGQGQEGEGQGQEGQGQEGEGRGQEGQGQEGEGRGQEGQGQEGEGRGQEGQGQEGEGRGQEGRGQEGEGRGQEGQGQEGEGQGQEGEGQAGTAGSGASGNQADKAAGRKWGLGQPIGNPTSLPPRGQGEILTVFLPSLGEAARSGGAAPTAESPSGPTAAVQGPPGPGGEPAREERPPQQSPPQQPLPAWIVHLLGKSPETTEDAPRRERP